MTTTLKSLLVATAIGVAGAAGGYAYAHGPAGWNSDMGPGMMGGPGYGMGYGPGGGMMMGPGMMGAGMMDPGMMGSGMMGYGGMGPGMMGYQGMGPGMMGYGMMGPGMMGTYGAPCAGANSGEKLSADDVRKNLERRLSWMGNDRLKVGKVTTKDGKIIAEVVTKDGSLVERMSIDPDTGYTERSN